MSRTVLSRFLALLGVGGLTVACNTGGEVIDNPIPDSEIEPNDTVGQATALGGPGQFLASGHCASATDVDHFALVTTSSGNASASIDLSGVALASVALLTSDGTVLASTTTDPLAVAAAITGTGGIAVLRVECAAESDPAGDGTGYSGTFETE